jgi:hypothetical protein
MPLTPSAEKFLSWMNNQDNYAGSGYVIFAGSWRPKMVGVNVLMHGPGPQIHLRMVGPQCGPTDSATLSVDQADELGCRILEMVARVRAKGGR